MKPSGYIHAHRCLLDAWQWSKPEWGYAWVTMLLMAEWEDNPEDGLKRGQFFSSVSGLSQRCKMSETAMRRFLHKAEKVEKDVIWERCPGGRKSGGVNGGVSGGVLSRFTIVKYDDYNRVSGGVSGGVSGSSSYRKKRKKVHTVFSKTVGDNSQVYDLFIKSRQKKLKKPEWLPTATQAVQMQTNIKGLLKRESLTEILSWVENYFRDDAQYKHKWSWSIFFSDPVRWSSQSLAGNGGSNNPTYKPLSEEDKR